MVWWLCISACGRFDVELLSLAPMDSGDIQQTDPDGGLPDAAALAHACVGSTCTAAGCPGDPTKKGPGVCGCGQADGADSDGDNTPDCVDFCPGAPDHLDDGSCSCAAAQADADGDGALNCTELCPFDPKKQTPGMCGCGATDVDSDGDGTPDCLDACPLDVSKSVAGACGCGVSEEDTDLDGTPDCLDSCSGNASQKYTPNASCGVGYCRDHNVPSSCAAGVETTCQAGQPLNAADATCDGIDDNCNGATDDGFGMTTTCGRGVCLSQGMLQCVAGKPVDSCVALQPTAAKDVTCDGKDDDCDGMVDDDYPVTSVGCSTGACAAVGTVACASGVVVNSCMPSAVPSTTDTSCDNIDENCNGVVDEGFVSTSTSCGKGVCARKGSLTCVRGSTVDSCKAGSPTMTRDTTCNNQDEDCDGLVDDDYAATSTACGVGACAASGSLTCSGGSTRNSCVAKLPSTTTDDAFAPGNGIDDDCDGRTDEDVPACDTTPRTFEAGSYPNIAVPGNCKTVQVKLWGGGGAAGENVGAFSTAGGSGGPGGYVTATPLVKGTIALYVGGAAGSSGCSAAGTNAGSASFNGGAGGTGAGDVGADGVAAGGGAGGQPATGQPGGDGHYGGGGGGQGSGGFGASGIGGGGGAATVLTIGGVRAALAGGGGGGGGAQATTPLGTIASAGGSGGSGCSGAGQVQTSIGGGGGGGGLCTGSTTQTGSGTTPAAAGSLPSGRAKGGDPSCGAGGPGYAILTFAP